MPRFLHTCFGRLGAGEVHDAIVRYLRVSRFWPLLGLTASTSVRREGAVLWGARPALRPILAPHVLNIVCDEYVRAFRRAAEKHDELNHEPWLVAHPELGGQIAPFVIERAGQFRQTQSALRACVVWARHLEGGEDAWRQLANVWRWGWRNGDLRTEPHLQPNLTELEVERVNAYLAEDERLEAQARHHEEGDLGAILQDVILASRAVSTLSESPWSEDDDQRFADVLAQLPLAAQRRFRTKRCTKPLQRINDLAAKTTD